MTDWPRHLLSIQADEVDGKVRLHALQLCRTAMADSLPEALRKLADDLDEIKDRKGYHEGAAPALDWIVGKGHQSKKTTRRKKALDATK